MLDAHSHPQPGEGRPEPICLSSRFQDSEHRLCIGQSPISGNGMCGYEEAMSKNGFFLTGSLKVAEQREMERA